MNRQYNCNTHKQILCRERGMFPMTKYELEKENERLQKAIKVQEIMLGNQDYAIKKAKAEAIKEFADEAVLYTIQYAFDVVRKFIVKKTKLDPVYAFNPTEEELNEYQAEVRSAMRQIAKEMGVEL